MGGGKLGGGFPPLLGEKSFYWYFFIILLILTINIILNIILIITIIIIIGFFRFLKKPYGFCETIFSHFIDSAALFCYNKSVNFAERRILLWQKTLRRRIRACSLPFSTF